MESFQLNQIPTVHQHHRQTTTMSGTSNTPDPYKQLFDKLEKVEKDFADSIDQIKAEVADLQAQQLANQLSDSTLKDSMDDSRSLANQSSSSILNNSVTESEQNNLQKKFVSFINNIVETVYHQGRTISEIIITDKKGNYTISEKTVVCELNYLKDTLINNYNDTASEDRFRAFIDNRWLRFSQRINTQFIATLFLRPSPRSRIICCSHNPAYVERESEECAKTLSGSVVRVSSSVDLDDKVRYGNLARVEMITYNKYNTFVMNPLFDTGLQYTKQPNFQLQAPGYYVRGFNSRVRENSKTSLSTDDWCQRYSLHRAAYIGGAKTIDGYANLSIFFLVLSNFKNVYKTESTNEWRLEYLVAIKINRVNAQNKSGTTALHFACLNGNVYLLELLMSRPELDTEIRNKDGHKAIDLCVNVPKKEWQDAAKLLNSSKRVEKIQEMAGESCEMGGSRGFTRRTTSRNAQKCPCFFGG
uniref:ANK_REP_REGION domain-containing protein n=1 Tax=Heterorhabditis bacteriophora TaxID=37862 RepID=A0A1I7XH30_HETBA